jgi:hypothetical protein
MIMFCFSGYPVRVFLTVGFSPMAYLQPAVAAMTAFTVER